MIAVLAILGITVILFIFEFFRVDAVAILIMVLLGLSSLVPGYDGLVAPGQVFIGFSSNAVISIIAVMILGAGLDRTGLMNRLASRILKIAGNTEKRIVIFLAGTVGVISGFMQNIGAAALFLPVSDRISKRTSVPLPRLLMPMGYCAILGGTITMVGSSPLILLNDLMLNSNNLPGLREPMEALSLFAVTPIGVVLLIFGIAYFIYLGNFVFPPTTQKSIETGAIASYIQDMYGVTGQIFELRVRRDSLISQRTVGELEDEIGYKERIIAINIDGQLQIEPPRNTIITPNSDIAMMGNFENITNFANRTNLELKKEINVFQEVFSPISSGIAEIVVPPASRVINRTVGELGFRRNYRATLMACYRGDVPIREDLNELRFRAGDTLVVHSMWRDLTRFANSLTLVVCTDFPREDFRPNKSPHALVFFGITLLLLIFSDLKLPNALMVGAVGMILTGVIRIDEAYRSINWQSVFLLASLIPLGIAVQETGTATWIATKIANYFFTSSNWILLLVMAALSTAFTLVMSNVGAVVLLVPIAISVAIHIGADPTAFALTVAIATSNSFIIPTHQVNAMIQGPGGFRVWDFLRAGSLMTIGFLIITVIMVQLLYG